MTDDDELLALQKAAAVLDVSLDGASPRQIAVLRRSSVYQWTLFDLKVRRLGREIVAPLERVVVWLQGRLGRGDD